MQRLILRQGIPTRTFQLRRTAALPKRLVAVRCIQTDIDSKYKEKLLQRVKEAGLNLDDLKEQAKKFAEEQNLADRKALEETLPAHKLAQAAAGSTSSAKGKALEPKLKERKDSSPVKPLSSILNLEKLIQTPHAAQQISALWTAYHASRSNGTGRGFVCASVPADMYHTMEQVGHKYPSFVVPIPRPRPADAEPKEGENDTAYEFFFMEWTFHERPPVPEANDNPFHVSTSKNSPNPPLATVVFTPLQEYKLRQSFSTPYFIISFYTDLVATHQCVLMRGEITPGGASNFLLSQEDAQVLTMQLQKNYLWTAGLEESEAGKLLRVFHEKPEDFKWEDLIKAANLTTV